MLNIITCFFIFTNVLFCNYFHKKYYFATFINTFYYSFQCVYIFLFRKNKNQKIASQIFVCSVFDHFNSVIFFYKKNSALLCCFYYTIFTVFTHIKIVFFTLKIKRFFQYWESQEKYKHVSHYKNACCLTVGMTALFFFLSFLHKNNCSFIFFLVFIFILRLAFERLLLIVNVYNFFMIIVAFIVVNKNKCV